MPERPDKRKKKEDATTVFSVRLPNDILEKVDRIAASEDRQRSNMVLIAIKFWLASQEADAVMGKK